MKFYNKRLDLSEDEFDCLKKYINFEKIEEAIKNFDPDYQIEATESKLLEKLNNPKKIEYSFKKYSASEKATKARTKKAKEKIQTAIDILRMSHQKITHYSIAQTCGVSFTTVIKYLDDETLKSLNEIE